MANLLVLFGIVAYAWAHIPPGTFRVGMKELRTAKTVAFTLLMVFLVVQVAFSTRWSLTSGRTTRAYRVIAAQTIVNLDRMPRAEGRALVAGYVYPNLSALEPYLREAETDHISDFAPGPYRYYRAKGPPNSGP